MTIRSSANQGMGSWSIATVIRVVNLHLKNLRH
jgi:hypothetical protein